MAKKFDFDKAPKALQSGQAITGEGFFICSAGLRHETPKN